MNRFLSRAIVQAPNIPRNNDHFRGVEKWESKVFTEPNSTKVSPIILIFSKSFLHPILTFFFEPLFLPSFWRMPKCEADLHHLSVFEAAVLAGRAASSTS